MRRKVISKMASQERCDSSSKFKKLNQQILHNKQLSFAKPSDTDHLARAPKLKSP